MAQASFGPDAITSAYCAKGSVLVDHVLPSQCAIMPANDVSTPATHTSSGATAAMLEICPASVDCIHAPPSQCHRLPSPSVAHTSDGLVPRTSLICAPSVPSG